MANFTLPIFDNILHHGLYVVATPIGNKHDISLRALHILSSCNAILCEDTRVAKKLLQQYNINAPHLIAYHDHNEDSIIKQCESLHQKYPIMALISDAGTPLISDQGFGFVRACHQQNISVYSIPGANAGLSALSISGLPCDQFLFLGFPPIKPKAFDMFCQSISDDCANIIYLSVHKHRQQLQAFAQKFGTRPALLLRELTKLHEEKIGDNLQEISDYCQNHTLKGELVLIIGKSDAPQSHHINDYHDMMCALKDKNLSDKDIAHIIANHSGISKRSIYDYLLTIK